MPERDEAFDRALDRRLEIGIDPRVARGRPRPPERDERFRELPQIVDPRIDALRVRNDQSVGEAAFGHPAHGAEAVVAAALEKDRKVKTMLAEPALQPVEDGEEHGVDEGVVGAAGDDHGDQISSATSQAPPRLIGRIAELGRRFPHALACQRVNVGAVVQRARHRAD